MRKLVLPIFLLLTFPASAQASLPAQHIHFLRSAGGWGHALQHRLDLSIPKMKAMGLEQGVQVRAECDTEVRAGMVRGPSSYDSSLWYENSLQTPQRSFALIHLLRVQAGWNQLSVPHGWQTHWNRIKNILNWHIRRIQNIPVTNTCQQLKLWNGAGWQVGTIPSQMQEWSDQYLNYFNAPRLSSSDKKWWQKRLSLAGVGKQTQYYILGSGWNAQLDEAWRQVYLQDPVMVWAYPPNL